ncbi:hypothetical protein ACFL96_16990, partial [Thermoproteota archaeon]
INPTCLAKELKGVWNVVFLKKTKDYEIGGSKSIRIRIRPDNGAVLEHVEQDGFYLERRVGRR